MKRKKKNPLVTLIVLAGILCIAVAIVVMQKKPRKQVPSQIQNEAVSSQKTSEYLPKKVLDTEPTLLFAKRKALDLYTAKYYTLMEKKGELLEAYPTEAMSPNFFSEAFILTNKFDDVFEKSVITVCAIEAVLFRNPNAKVENVNVFLTRLTTGVVDPDKFLVNHDIMAATTKAASAQIISLTNPRFNPNSISPSPPSIGSKLDINLEF